MMLLSFRCGECYRDQPMIKGFHKPKTIEEAVRLKEELGDQAFFLAGGTEINSKDFPFSPAQLISLEPLALKGIEVAGTALILGACCTIQELIEAVATPECLKAAGRHIANRNIRNVATIGGHLAGNKSCGDLIPILVALEASVDTVASKATRTIPLTDYLASERQVLITRIRIPKNHPPRLAAVGKHSRTANGISILTAAVTLVREEDIIKDPIIALGGVAEHVLRLKAVEGKLHARALPSREEIENWVTDRVAPIADLRGGVGFKKYLAGVLVAATTHKAFQGEGGEV